MKSKLIQSIDSEAVVLVDGTRIEADTSYNEYGHGTPCGFDVSDAITPTEHPLYYEVLAAKEQEIAALKEVLVWLAEVQHVANFHDVTDWHKCSAVTCVYAHRALLMGDNAPVVK